MATPGFPARSDPPDPPAAESVQPESAEDDSPEPSVEDLYRGILPRPLGDAEPDAAEERNANAPSVAAPGDDGAHDGLRLGSVQIWPRLDALYVRAEGALFDTAEPVEDRYYEMRPQVGAEMLLRDGALRGSYRAHVRSGSSFDVVDSTTTHLADLSLDYELGGRGRISVAEHFARGVLETAEIDPGREYFFRLGRFTRHRERASLRLLPGGRADVTFGGSRDVSRVDDRAGFFDHEERTASAQLGYEVRPNLRAALGYGYTRIPFTAERAEAESDIHTAFAAVSGEILPLTNGDVSIGYSDQRSPHAGPGGERYTGLTASGRLEKSFTPSTTLTVAGSRATHVSGFERNAFYVTSAVEVLLRAAAPASFTLTAGAGYHRNGYRTVASLLGVPREDAIRGWTLGVGRAVTHRGFLRADYRRERRDSNLDVFDSSSNALVVQLGVGFFDREPR